MQKMGVPINSRSTGQLQDLVSNQTTGWFRANLGTLCQGHGASLKSCGHDRMKLNICGRKNNRSLRVFENWS